MHLLHIFFSGMQVCSAVSFFFWLHIYWSISHLNCWHQIAVQTSTITQVDRQMIGSSSSSSADPRGCFAGSRLSSPPGTLWAQAKGKCCRWAHHLVLAESCPSHQRMPKPAPCYCTALARAELHILAVSRAWMTTNADRLAWKGSLGPADEPLILQLPMNKQCFQMLLILLVHLLVRM
jgi:hypothetical protein